MYSTIIKNVYILDFNEACALLLQRQLLIEVNKEILIITAMPLKKIHNLSMWIIGYTEISGIRKYVGIGTQTYARLKEEHERLRESGAGTLASRATEAPPTAKTTLK